MGDSTAASKAEVTLDVTYDGGAQQPSQPYEHNSNGCLGCYPAGSLLNALTVGAGTATQTGGVLTLTGTSATGTGKVNIVNNAASQALGLATIGGGDNDNGATAAKTLDLNIDGVGPVHVDISGQSDLAGIASAIASQTFTQTGQTVTATAADGSIHITGNTLGTAGSVDVIDNTVSRALKLTTNGNVDQKGTAAQLLHFNVDGIGDIGVDISGVTSLTANGDTGLVHVSTLL